METFSSLPVRKATATLAMKTRGNTLGPSIEATHLARERDSQVTSTRRHLSHFQTFLNQRIASDYGYSLGKTLNTICFLLRRDWHAVCINTL
jgi:hypothetical protein